MDRAWRRAARCAYADASLRPQWDWEKYLDTYRVWGHKLYNPDAEVEVEPGARRRQPHSADRHHRASALGRKQQLLA